MNSQCGNKQLCWLLCIAQIQLIGHLRRQNLLVTQTKALLPPHPQVLTATIALFSQHFQIVWNYLFIHLLVYCLSFSSRM